MNRIYLFLMAMLVSIGASAAKEYQLKASRLDSWAPKSFTFVGTGDGYDEYELTATYDRGGDGALVVYLGDTYYKATGSDKMQPGKWYPSESAYLTVNGNDDITTNGTGGDDFFYEYTNYRFVLRDYGNENLRLYAEKYTEPEAYYFYGDMNRWSALYGEDGTGSRYDYAGTPVTISDLDGNDLTDYAFPDSKQYRCTAEELKRDWKFQYVENRSELPAAIQNVEGNWYVLDFTKLQDSNGNARLCGQFKITKGVYNGGENFGIALGSGDEALADYLTKQKIKANEIFTSGKKSSGLQNFQLEANYMTNAKIYFNPGADQDQQPCSIYIDVPSESDVHKIYTYYAVFGNEDYDQPTSQELKSPTQINYYVNYYGYNHTDRGDLSSYDFNPVINGERQYRWEKYYGEDGNGVERNGMHFTYVYRRQIPYGATHRYPVGLTVDLVGRNGHQFLPREVDCDDIWFIEGDVNVWFRYEDPTRNPDQVGFNIFAKQYHPEYLYEIDPIYYNATDDAHKQQGDWIIMDKGVKGEKAGTENYEWFKSPVSIENYEWASGTYALFRTSEGANFPVGGWKALAADLKEAFINGQDLYYVVPNPDPEIHILYTHLNGSFQLGSEAAGHSFQIQGEFFDPESGELDTRYNDEAIRYSFEVRDNQGNVKASQDYSNQPYMECDPASWGAGYYNVIVKVKVDDREYTASDIYAVYPAAK